MSSKVALPLHPLRVVSRQFLVWLEAKAKAEDRSIPYLLRKLIQAEMACETRAKTKKKKAKS